MEQENFYTTISSPLGDLVITSNGKAITGLYVPGNTGYKQAQQGTEKKSAAPFAEAAKQLGEYFAGKRNKFELPLAPQGTDFQQKVWSALAKIPHGKTKTYGEIAESLKQPTASRAVGAANGKNPISIIVPCHRVIGSTGKLTGYNGGVKVKQWLLTHEAS